jgi:hypothetical protein
MTKSPSAIVICHFVICHFVIRASSFSREFPMTTDFDVSGDFAAVTDGVEPVTFRRRDAAADSPCTPVPHALRRAAATAEGAVHNLYNSEKQAPSGGRYTAADVTWHLPCEELSEAPDPGDVILDAAGQRWTILEAKLATLGTRWQCTARNLALACGLTETIVVLRATYGKGPGGAAEPAWFPWRTGVRARIQPAEVNMSPGPHAQQTAARYRIFL